jgi:hypothetical protein
MRNIITVNGRSPRAKVPRDIAPGTGQSRIQVSGGRLPRFGVGRGLGSPRRIRISGERGRSAKRVQLVLIALVIVIVLLAVTAIVAPQLILASDAVAREILETSDSAMTTYPDTGISPAGQLSQGALIRPHARSPAGPETVPFRMSGLVRSYRSTVSAHARHAVSFTSNRDADGVTTRLQLTVIENGTVPSLAEAKSSLSENSWTLAGRECKSGKSWSSDSQKLSRDGPKPPGAGKDRQCAVLDASKITECDFYMAPIKEDTGWNLISDENRALGDWCRPVFGHRD